MKTYPIIIALLFASLVSLKSQEINVSDSLIGSWMCKGPGQIDLNDAIELVKATSTDNNYYLWTFRPYSNRLERTYNYNSNSNKPNSIAATKIDKWFFNNKTEILTLDFYNYTQQFKIIESNGKVIKLLRIK
jgi:hypothetical protein